LWQGAVKSSFPEKSVIRRRHVFYVEGYDPQGAQGYYDMFRRSWKRFREVWRCQGRLGELALDSDLIAHWDLVTSAPNWQVETHYEFLRLERIIEANMADPIWRLLPRAFVWMFDDLFTGTIVRIFRASWRFALHLLYFQGLLCIWIALAVAAGWLAALATGLAGLPALIALAVGTAAGLACFFALWRLALNLHVIQIVNCWPYLREFAGGRISPFDAPVDACAARVVAAAGANAADEIVVVGHSAAGVTATAVMARALERDPDLGRHGPKVVLLTLGSVMPAAALHPAAVKIRHAIERIATEPSVTWIDCQSRKDVMNFWEFDPVEGVGLKLGGRRRNPVVWPVKFKEMASPEYYRRFRLSLFRLHYHFLISGDRRAPFDYLMLVAGPLPIAEWARRHDQLVEAFAEDASFLGDADGGSAAREVAGSC
jgi:hypothetical protein